PCGQGRRDLPGGEHERRVPRRDHADRADRFAAGVVEVVVAGQRQAVACAGSALGEEAEVLGAALGRLPHEAQQLPCVDDLEQRDLFGVALDQRGQVEQQLLAPRRAEAAPALEGGRGGGGGSVDVAFV